MNKYKPLSLAAILALIFTLSACSEQLLETVAEDPEPDITSGEADSTTSQVLAENSADNERSPQPNDITLGSYNGSDENESNDINGQSKNMPIRIPFNAPITDLYLSDGNLSPDAAGLYASNIFIVGQSLNTGATLSVLPLPWYDRNNNDVSGVADSIANTGGEVPNSSLFRSVYLDANNDLVLVPGFDTFQANAVYFVVVSKNLLGADGQTIIPDTLTQLLTTNNKLIDDANTTINSSLLEDINGNGVDNDENDTASVASLEAARVAYVGTDGNGGTVANIVAGLSADQTYFTSREDVAIIFHFTTADDSGQSDTNNALESALSTAAQYKYSNDDISWLNEDLNATSATPINIKSQTDAALQDLGLTFAMNWVNALYKGFVPCTNYLQNAGIDRATGSARWELNLTKNNTDSGDEALEDCPNSLAGMDGNLGFWAAKPVDNPVGLVVFQHGITSHKDSLFYIINTFAEFGYSSIAIDAWGHGERGYEDGNANGTIENTMASGYADSGLLFIRPDAPDLSAGYYLQTLLDIYRVAYVTGFNSITELENSEIQTAIGFFDPIGLADSNATDGQSNAHYVGVSLGGIMGATISSILNTSNETIAPFGKYVLNVPGGDVTDIVFNGSFGPGVRSSVATAQGYDTSTVEGQQSLNSTMVAIDLLTSHTFFTALMDPLYWAHPAVPTNVLMQEIVGDSTVPNSNTELLAQSMNLIDYADGDGSVNTVDDDTVDGIERLRWTFSPSNYVSGSDTPGHGFLLDSGDSNASDQAQKQVGCYLRDGVVPDPTKTINTTSVCSNN